MQKALIYLLVIVVIAFQGCKSFMKIPAVPQNELSSSEELKYIFKTDQKDRRQVLLKVLFSSEEKYNKDPKIIAVSERDSIRLKRVMQIKEESKLETGDDFFHAGFIYLHGGGAGMQDDLEYLKTAKELFQKGMEKAEKNSTKRKCKVYSEEAAIIIDNY